MSAYMCSERQLSVLAEYGATHCAHALPYAMTCGPHKRDYKQTLVRRVFSMLVAENVASLEARYPGDPSNMAAVDGHELKPDAEALAKATPALHIIKLCHHYAYQSCEHDGWEASKACAFIRAIEWHAVRQIPGYDAAPWGI